MYNTRQGRILQQLLKGYLHTHGTETYLFGCFTDTQHGYSQTGNE